MAKIWHLKTCDTCRRIIQEHPAFQEMEMREIKSQPPTANEIDEMARLAGSYEAIFNQRCQLLKQLPDKDQLNEKRYRELLISHYSYLKRPVIVLNNKLFAGNSSSLIEAAAKEAQI